MDGLSLKVPRSAVYGFLGRNGTGKTTTIKSLLGLVCPTGGSATGLGFDVVRDTIAILQGIGFVGEIRSLHEAMAPAQQVRFNRRFFPLWSDRLAERFAQRDV